MGREIREEPVESGDGGWAVQAAAKKLARAGGGRQAGVRQLQEARSLKAGGRAVSGTRSAGGQDEEGVVCGL